MAPGREKRRFIRGRLRLRRTDPQGGPEQDQLVEIDAAELTGVLAVPSWLRDLGLAAWLLVGVTLLMVGIVWLLSLTDVIVTPVLTAAVVAAVASPLVGWLHRRGFPRGLASALLLLAIVGLGVVVVVVIIAGITSQSAGLASHLSDATSKLEGWLQDLGVNAGSAQSAKDDASSS